ncbi:hypothetical protein QI262_03805 [Staphylococcus saprophyticus]|nr:hypothetical protein [Staphylococcus saprophyticus]
MVKIKQKKQLNLPQLIEWAWDNDIRDTMIKLKSEYPAKQGIVIDNGGRLHLVGMDYLSKSNTFTVEVEEEITLDTVFETLIEIYKNAENLMFSTVHRNVSINNVKTNEYLITSGFYILNDDLTMTLIWRDGKLVE